MTRFGAEVKKRKKLRKEDDWDEKLNRREGCELGYRKTF